MTWQVLSRGPRRLLDQEHPGLKTELQDNAARLGALVEDLAPGLLNEPARGPITTATILASYSPAGRFISEAQFASLDGAVPIPASSSNVTRHWFNSFGDRHLNNAFRHDRPSPDASPRAYPGVHEGKYEAKKNYHEIKWELKRYLLRPASPMPDGASRSSTTPPPPPTRRSRLTRRLMMAASKWALMPSPPSRRAGSAAIASVRSFIPGRFATSMRTVPLRNGTRIDPAEVLIARFRSS